MKVRIFMPRALEARSVSIDKESGEIVIEPRFAVKTPFAPVALVAVESDDGARKVVQQLRVHASKGTLVVEAWDEADAEFDTPDSAPSLTTTTLNLSGGNLSSEV